MRIKTIGISNVDNAEYNSICGADKDKSLISPSTSASGASPKHKIITSDDLASLTTDSISITLSKVTP